MTNISKCLVILALVASLAFLGTISVSMVGGPNFETAFNEPALDDVFLEKKVDEETGKATYTVQTAIKRPSVADNPDSELASKYIDKDSKILPQTIIKAHEFITKGQKVTEEELDQEIKHFIAKISAAQQHIKTDQVALELRVKVLGKTLIDTYTKLEEINRQAADAATQTLTKMKIAEWREQEIQRLRSQVNVMKAEQYRLQEQIKKFRLNLVELEGINELLLKRREQLLKQGATAG